MLIILLLLLRVLDGIGVWAVGGGRGRVRALEVVGLGGWVISFLGFSFTLILTWLISRGRMISSWFFWKGP